MAQVVLNDMNIVEDDSLPYNIKIAVDFLDNFSSEKFTARELYNILKDHFKRNSKGKIVKFASFNINLSKMWVDKYVKTKLYYKKFKTRPYKFASLKYSGPEICMKLEEEEKLDEKKVEEVADEKLDEKVDEDPGRKANEKLEEWEEVVFEKARKPKFWCLEYHKSKTLENAFINAIITEDYLLDNKNIAYNPGSMFPENNHDYEGFVSCIKTGDYIIVPDNVDSKKFYMTVITNDTSRNFRDMFKKVVMDEVGNIIDVFSLLGEIDKSYLTNLDLDIQDLKINYKHCEPYKTLALNIRRKTYPGCFQSFCEIKNEKLQETFLTEWKSVRMED